MTALTRSSLAPITLAQLTADSVVICATQRLAQTLSRAHDDAAGGRDSWATLASTTFGQWLQARYAALALRGLEPPALAGLRVLDGFQERLLWEQVIHQSLGANATYLFDMGALAATAAEAHALTINWQIAPARASTLFASEEQRRFAEWQTAFVARCQTLGVIDGARLSAALIDALDTPGLALPSQVVFAGFDHFTPLERRLQQSLSARGCLCLELVSTDESIATQTRVEQTAHLDAECLAVAHWARDWLTRDPKARLGIVAPDLASYQYPLTDALEDVLAPDLVLPQNAAKRRPYNISLGQPLAVQPLVRAALNLLQILTQSHAVAQTLVSDVLGSTYWSVDTESDARARLDTAMREGIAPKAPLARYSDFADYLFEKQQVAAPATLGYLSALGASTRSLGKSRLPSEWRRIIQAVLGNGGWLANGRLRSHEFQAREAFGKELAQLSQLDQITGSITFSKAVSLLTQLCAERLFQPKTTGTPPIQILGVLEAAGMRFDALRVIGLTDTAWPPVANPNPLLPVEALRAAGAPNASALVQLNFATRIQDRLMRSAPDITFSYPRMNEATEQQPSPLIPKTAPVQITMPPTRPWADAIDPTGSHLQTIDDVYAPAVAAGDNVNGGTALLRAQAICPAWGYYQYRLGAKALAQPVEGLDPRKRGTLVHDTLEFFWCATQTFAALKAMSDKAREVAVARAASDALTRFNSDRKREALKPRQTELEHRRLVRLVDAWLQLECGRKTDFVVLEAEGKREINVAGIVAHMRIDRIDRLDDGRTLIIDYKTGADIDVRNWAADRITEPQLPIYAAIAEHPDGSIAGVAFGIVHMGGSGFRGVGQDDQLLPNVHAISSKRGRQVFNPEKFPDWESVLQHWRQAIHSVADEIRAGFAGVSITDEVDLRYCDVKPLLRLAERQMQLDATLAAEHTEVPQ